MNLSLKQFQDLLCKNGCGFMARPALQGYCPKCWAEKCLPSSSSESNDSNGPTEPNLSAMTPLSGSQNGLQSETDTVNTTTNYSQTAKVKGASVAGSTSVGRKAIGSGGKSQNTAAKVQSQVEKVEVKKVRISSSKSLPQITPKDGKGSQISPTSIENILSMTGVTERPLTFWDVDGGEDGTEDISGQSSSLLDRKRERSPSPDLEVLDVKRPEPELITIDDTDEVTPIRVVVTPKLEPVNITVLQNSPSVRPQGGVHVQSMSPQVRPMSTPVQPILISPQVRPMATQVQPMSPQVRPIATQVQPMSPQVRPMATQVQPMSPQVRPMATQVQPMSPQVRPMATQVQPISPQVQQMSAQVQSMSQQVGLMSAQMQSISPQVRPMSPQVQTTSPQVGSSVPAERHPTMSSQPGFPLISPPTSTVQSPVQIPSPVVPQSIVPANAAPMDSALEAIQNFQRALSGALVAPKASDSTPPPKQQKVASPGTRTQYFIIKNQGVPKGKAPLILQPISKVKQPILLPKPVRQQPAVQQNVVVSTPPGVPHNIMVQPSTVQPNTLVQQSSIQPMFYQLQTNTSVKPQTTPSNQQVFYQVQTTGQTATSSASNSSRPIILSKSPVKVTKQASQGSHVRLETHPVSSSKTTVQSSMAAIVNNKTVMAYKTLMPKPGGPSIPIVLKPHGVLPFTSNTTSTSNIPVVASRQSIPTMAISTSTPNILVVRNRPGIVPSTAISTSTQSVPIVMKPNNTLTCTSSTTATFNSPLWADWRKKIVGDKPPSRSSSPVSSTQQSNSQTLISKTKSVQSLQVPIASIPKPPQPTRLLQIMAAHTYAKPTPKSFAPSSSIKKSNTPFSALLQHFHNQTERKQPDQNTPRSSQQVGPATVKACTRVPTTQRGTAGVVVWKQSSTSLIRYPSKPVRRLNRKPLHKCRYCRKRFRGDVRYFRNHLWMHRQKYRPYWYEEEDDVGESESKHRPQIGRRPFLLLYTPGSNKRRKPTQKSSVKFTCKLCSLQFTDVDVLICHENVHSRDKKAPFAHCKICGINLRWSTGFKNHSKSTRHVYLRKTFENMAQSCRDSSSELIWTLWHSKQKRPLRSRYIQRIHPSTQALSESGQHLAQNCRLCNVNLSDDSVVDHMTSHSHLQLRKQFEKMAQSCKDKSSIWTKWIKRYVTKGTCKTCRKEFDSKTQLEEHELVHTRASLYPLKCNVCGAPFARPELLATHKRLHDIENPCKHCNSRFATAEDLKSHMRKQHPDVKPCICKECSACFVDDAELDRHMHLLHKAQLESSSTEDETVGSFACSYCTETFKDKNNLNIHQKIHNPNLTGEEEPVVVNKVLAAAKPCHICLKCGKEFRNISSLKGHMESHRRPQSRRSKSGVSEQAKRGKSTKASPPKRFNCPTCQKLFKTNGALASHSRTHTQALKKLSSVSKKPSSSTKKRAPSSTKSNTKSSLAATNELFSRSGILKRILGSDSVSAMSDDPLSEGLSVTVSSGGENRVYDPNKNVIVNQTEKSEQGKTSESKNAQTKESQKDATVNEKEKSQQIKISESENAQQTKASQNAQETKLGQYSQKIQTEQSQNAQQIQTKENPKQIQTEESLDVQRIQTIKRPAIQQIQSKESPNVQQIQTKERLHMQEIQTKEMPQIQTKESQNVQRIQTTKRPATQNIQSKESPNVQQIQTKASSNVQQVQTKGKPDVKQVQTKEKPNKDARDKTKPVSTPKALKDASGSQDDPRSTSYQKPKRSPKLSKCKECNRLFLSKAKLRSHEKCHTLYRPYKCEHCNKRFVSQKVWMDHKKVHLPYPCSTCGESWVTYMGLVNHAVASHGVQRDSLMACRTRLPSTKKGHRSSRGHRCIYCNRRFNREAMRVHSHMRNHTVRYKVFWQKKLKVAMKGSTIGDMLMQTVDGLCNDGKGQMETVDINDNGELIRKLESNKPQTAQADGEPSELQYECACGKKYAWKKSLVAHQRKERHGDAEVKSSQGGQTGTSKITQDVKEPSGAPYQCTDCSQTFALWRLREEHIRRVHKNFTCQYCQKTFLVYQILMKHEKKHKMRGDVIKRPDVGTGDVVKPPNMATSDVVERPNLGTPDVIKRTNVGSGDVIKPSDVGMSIEEGSKEKATVAEPKGQEQVEKPEGEKPGQSGEDGKKTSPPKTDVKIKEEPVSSDDSGSSSDSSWEGASGAEGGSSDEGDADKRKSIQQNIKMEKKEGIAGDTDDDDDDEVSDFKCKTCGRSFRRKVSLIQHERVHELDNQSGGETDGDSSEEKDHLKCDQCDRTFSRLSSLTNHKRAHTEKKYKCDLCPKSFEKYLLLLRHNRAHHPGHKVIAPGSKAHLEKNQKFVCQVCFEEFTDAEKMAEHKKLHSSESKFACHVCNAVFNQSWDLIVHKRTHSRVDLRLHGAPQASTSEQGSSTTVQASNPENQTSPKNVDYKCSYCGYVCTDSTHLAKHEEVHRTQFTCTFCGKVFDENDALVAHLKNVHYAQRSVAEGESNNPAKNNKGGDDARASLDLSASDDDDDDDNFSDFGEQADSDSHDDDAEDDDVAGPSRYPRRRVVKRKKYTSSDEDDLIDRYPKRARSRPLYTEPTEQDLDFQDDDKKKTVSQSAGSNTENEPFKCSYCGIGFMLEDDWSFHEYQHSQDMPFRCQFCYRAFSRRVNLNQHEKTHKGRKPYKCVECGKRFAMDTHLKDHKEKEHSKAKGHGSRQEKHVSKALDPYPHNCSSCGKGFYKQFNLIKHQERCDHSKHKAGSTKKTFDSSLYVGERNAAKLARLQMVADQESSDVDAEVVDVDDDNVDFDEGSPETEESENDESSKEVLVKQEMDTAYKCRFCTRSFPFKKSLMNHEIKGHRARGPHTCSTCDAAYWYPYELKRHEEGHKKKPNIKPGPKAPEELSDAFKCHHCNQGFSTQQLLIKHQEIHVKQQPSIKCKFCLKVFANEVELQNHERTHTAPSEAAPHSSFGCLFCHEMFTLKSALIDHIQTHTGHESYMCPHCDLTFPTSATLQAHEKEHFQPMFQCSSCQALFRDKDKLVKHEASHKVNGYPCQFCGLKFIAKKGLSSHINSKHSEAKAEQASGSSVVHSKKPVLQPIVRLEALPQKLPAAAAAAASKTASSYSHQAEEAFSESDKEGQMKQDEEMDAIVNPYSCNICKKSFPSPEDVKKHVRIHSKGHSKKCHYCGKVFEKHHALKKHLQLHLRSFQIAQDGGGDFKCQVCGIQIKTKAGLVSHMKSHARSKAKPFSFHKRSAGFGIKTKPTLKAPKTSAQEKKVMVPSVKKEPVVKRKLSSDSSTTSSPAKMAACRYCNITILSTSMKRHIKLKHTKDRPCKCIECDLRFATTQELHAHMKDAHGDVKAYRCEYCSKRFLSIVNLTNHTDKAHPGAKVGTDQEIFRCKFCNKAFGQKRYVRRHEAIHIQNGDSIPRTRTVSSSSDTTATPPRKKFKMHDGTLPLTVSQSSSDTSPTTSLPQVASGNLYDCKYCSFQFITREDLKRHERTHPGEKPYSCDDCDKSFYDRSHLTQHRMRTHSSKLVSTSGSSKEKQTEKTSSKVDSETAVEIMYSCKLCTKVFHSSSSLNKHLTIKHKTKSLHVESKSKSQKLAVGTKSGVAGKVREKNHGCSECDKRYYTYSHLRDHFERVHLKPKEEKSSPPKTKPSTSTNVSDKTDELTKVREKRFACGQCDKRYYKKLNLKHHVEKNHAKKTDVKEEKEQEGTKSGYTLYSCNLCSRNYYSDIHLKDHYAAAHNMQQPPAKRVGGAVEGVSRPVADKDETWPCKVCGFQFTMRCNLHRHMKNKHPEVKWKIEPPVRREKQDKMFSCQDCNMRFQTEEHLEEHFSKEHEGKESQSDEFGTPKTDMPVREKKYACDMCDKRYYKTSHLNVHKNRIHFGHSPAKEQKMMSKSQASDKKIANLQQGKGLTSKTFATKEGYDRIRENKVNEIGGKKTKPVSSQHQFGGMKTKIPASGDSSGNQPSSVNIKASKPKKLHLKTSTLSERGHSVPKSKPSTSRAATPSQAVYACHVCERTFSKRDSLAVHLQKYHS